jgi:hypothetical protein
LDCFRVYFHVVTSLTGFAIFTAYAFVQVLQGLQRLARTKRALHAIKRPPLHLFVVESGLEAASCPAPLLFDQYLASPLSPVVMGRLYR